MPIPASSANCDTVYTVSQLAQLIEATIQGDGEVQIHGLATLQSAGAGQLSFLANPTFKKYLATTEASAVILRPPDAQTFAGNALVVDNPYLAYARLSAIFAPQIPRTGVHTSAVVDNAADVGQNVAVGPHAVIEAGAVIGDACIIGAGSVIGRDCVIGEESIIYANVTVYHSVKIGARARIHSGVVIGSDGFGFAPQDRDWTKIHQLGGVVIGDDVELGAGTCIDRGALDNTEIGDGVKVDNLVHIAHNVRIGSHTILCGCSGIAGSTVVGANCIIGGAVGIINNLVIADGVTLTAGTLVTKSITDPGVYSSGTPLMANKEWRKNAATFPRLYELYQIHKKFQKS